MASPSGILIGFLLGCSSTDDGSNPGGSGGTSAGAPQVAGASTRGGNTGTPGGVGGAGAPTVGGTSPGGANPGGTNAGGTNPGTAGSAGTTVGGSPSGGTSGAPSGGASGGPMTAGAGGASGSGPTPTAGGGSGGAAGGSSGGGGTPNGTGGSAGSAGSSPGGAGSPSTGKGFFSEDFESGTVGQQPAGWDNFIGYVKNGMNPQGSASALVSDTRKHGGSKALHVKGGQQPAMITRPLPSGTNKLYARAWIYQTRQLGMNPNANHETLIGIRRASGDAGDEVRFGEIKGVIGTNVVPGDNIAPKMDQWGKGPVVAANEWACFEVAFLADQPVHQLKGWVNGMLVHEITAVDQWQNGAMPATWMNGKFVEFIIGWHSFSNQSNELWIDDIVLSNEPIGCQ